MNKEKTLFKDQAASFAPKSKLSIFRGVVGLRAWAFFLSSDKPPVLFPFCNG